MLHANALTFYDVIMQYVKTLVVDNVLTYISSSHCTLQTTFNVKLEIYKATLICIYS